MKRYKLLYLVAGVASVLMTGCNDMENTTLKLLQNQKHEKNAVIATEGGTAARGMQVLDEVDALQTEHGKLSQQLQSYAKEKEALEAWGNFEPANVQKLKDANDIVGHKRTRYILDVHKLHPGGQRTGSTSVGGTGVFGSKLATQ